MEKQLLHLKTRKKIIYDIFDDIVNDSSVNVKDNYELSDNIYNFFKSKDKTWIDNFYNMVNSLINMKKKNISNFLQCDDFPKEIIDYFFDGIFLADEKKIIDEDSDIQEDLDQIEIDNNRDEKFFDNFEWREGQLEAIDAIKSNNFESGIVSMITGSGKSLIFLNTIQIHAQKIKYEKGSVYILMCPRIDVVQSLFFKKNKYGEFVLNQKKISEWKKHNIIDIENNKFKIIDCVNNKDKNFNFSKNRPNLLLINNDFFRSICKIEKYYDYICKNTQFIIIDECHCISGDKIYEIIEKLKYDFKIPIIGFSATPIRDSKKSVNNVVQIFSKTKKRDDVNKKIKLIYSYDLLRGIKDNVCLPYMISYVEIKKIKGHKIGLTNKEKLTQILKNCIDVEQKNLPYKKFIIWTNRKNLLRECYKYIEKEFKNLKVYCTSSFDEEFKAEGLNTDYNEFHYSKGNCVLVCINKCKEGSDIPNVDCGIYFDGVKNRSVLVHIQTSGRITRPDKLRKKTHGHIIDTYILEKGESYNALTAQKILSNITRLLNLSDDEYTDEISFYEKMMKIVNKLEYNVKEKLIKIKIDENKNHDTLMNLGKFDWNVVKAELIKQTDKKFGIDQNKKFNLIIDKIKKIKYFNKHCDFWEMYNKYQSTYDLPENFKEEFKYKFENNTWYEILEFDTSDWYQKKEQVIKIVGNNCSKDKYNKLVKKNNKLPPHPEYMFGDFWNYCPNLY